ncbi:MAG: hypothetical protein ACOWWM_04955 [Desulfobacterales bacterium]
MSKKYKTPPGTWLERGLFESTAFNALKGWAPQLLVLILAKRRFENCGRKGKDKRVCMNGNAITFTYIEAEKKFGATKPRFTRAIDDLLAKGFISIKHTGGAFQQDKTIYALSEKWRLWRPGMVIHSRQKETVTRGYRKK